MNNDTIKVVKMKFLLNYICLAKTDFFFLVLTVRNCILWTYIFWLVRRFRYLEDTKILKRSFNHPDLIHIPRTLNTRADSLAQSARQQSLFVVHIWMSSYQYGLQSLSWVCVCCWQKKKRFPDIKDKKVSF